jgi:hypothetical protein
MVVGTPSELNSNASKYSFPVNNNKVVAIIDQMDSSHHHGLSKLIGKQYVILILSMKMSFISIEFLHFLFTTSFYYNQLRNIDNLNSRL